MTTTCNHATDLQLTLKHISDLASAAAIATFFTSLDYDTGARTGLTEEAIGLSGESAAPLSSIKLLSEDREGFLRIVFVRLRSPPAKSRNDLARVYSRERFMESVAALSAGKKGEQPAAELMAEVETCSGRPDLRFFHWEIDFPEVFFGSEDPNERRITHKGRVAADTAGFDAVVGNPPWGGLRALRDLAQHFKSSFATARKAADWFALFVEGSLRWVRGNGHCGIVIPSRWREAPGRGFSRNSGLLRQIPCPNDKWLTKAESVLQ